MQPICSSKRDGSGDDSLLQPDDINGGTCIETKVGKRNCCSRESAVNKAISHGHHRGSGYSHSVGPEFGRPASEEYGMAGFGSLNGGTTVCIWLFLLIIYLKCDRIDIQDKVRRLEKEPREEARSEIERLRHILTAEFLLLQTLFNVHGEGGLVTGHMEEGDPTAFDNLDDDPVDPGPEPDSRARRKDNPNDLEVLPPERRTIMLPSTHFSEVHPLRKLELTLRIKQATRYLAAIREAVAEKSFQYSHVMRKSPSKGVRTRSRAVIAKLNERIALRCRVYGRARSALVQLGADEDTLKTLQVLSKDDVKASSAIVNPNSTGSSSVTLSWIWHSRAGLIGSGPDLMHECKLLPCHIYFLFLLI